MVRIFLVDDHAIIRESLRSLLSHEPDFEVVGEAGTGQELLDQLPHTTPDVVLLDVNMPVLDGYATTLHLRAQHPHLHIIALSMLADMHHVNRMLANGAHGYMLKNAGKREIFTAIRRVMDGRRYVDPAVVTEALPRFIPPADAPPSKPNVLSTREQEVLQLIADGLTNHQIAERLFRSHRTIETHRQNILEKTQSKNTAALIKYSVENGLIN